MNHTLHIGTAGQNLVDLANATDSILMDSNTVSTNKDVLVVLSNVANNDTSSLLQQTGLIAPVQTEANNAGLRTAGNLRRTAASCLKSN